jgi:hypothetical protein
MAAHENGIHELLFAVLKVLPETVEILDKA